MELSLNSLKRQESGLKLDKKEISSLVYHDLFNYPLNFEELIKWRCSFDISTKASPDSKNGYYFLKGRGGLIFRRLLRERNAARKLQTADKVSFLMSFIPSIKMLGVTGSLAMKNTDSESDIDLMLITKKGTLWTTRFLCYALLKIFGFRVRRPSEKEEKDKLCLNMWLDEGDMTIRKRNIYTAHEIAQIVPLLNKDNTHQKFIWKNRWVEKYWPNACKPSKQEILLKNPSFITRILEFMFFKLQYLKMREKITSEVVRPTRAFFHPNDWGKVVISQLSS